MNKNLEKFMNALEAHSHFLLFDLEANFTDDEELKERETIQIWYVKFTSSGEIIGKGSIYIKPTQRPILSEFIKDFTGISQEVIDNAQSFPEWLGKFLDMFSPESDYLLSYGNYDMKQILHDCKINDIAYPFDEWDDWNYSRHINIKNALAKKLKIWEKWMKTLMGVLWLELLWKHHNGEDDCENIHKIILHVFWEDMWVKGVVGLGSIE